MGNSPWATDGEEVRGSVTEKLKVRSCGSSQGSGRQRGLDAGSQQDRGEAGPPWYSQRHMATA